LFYFFSSEQLGKPAAADLELGLATAPVLFASAKFPELEAMIARRFSKPGDVQAAFEAVLKSDGLDKTRALARTHCEKALLSIEPLASSRYKLALSQLTDTVLTRLK
jgi:decaprenyl-diphosphate synthase subunit 1